MPKNKIITYNPKLKPLARELRKNMTLAEILLWKQIRRKRLGVEFHRQVPIDNYIVDFYCHEIRLAIEIDGSSHLFQEVEVCDIERQSRLEKLGVRFIRFDNKEILSNIEEVIRKLEVIIKQLNLDYD